MRTEKEIMDEITALAKEYHAKRWALLEELRKSQLAETESFTIVG